MSDPAHRSTAELEAHLPLLRRSPSEVGRVDFLLRRPSPGEREVLAEAMLDSRAGLVGDDWLTRGSRRTPDGSAHPEMQLNLINARMSALLSEDPLLRAGTGDQLHLDLDLSGANLPAGSRLQVGDEGAVVEVTAIPHRGCAKFLRRYGEDAMRFVNSRVGRELNLRGANASVVAPGRIRVGDVVRRLPAGDAAVIPR